MAALTTTKCTAPTNNNKTLALSTSILVNKFNLNLKSAVKVLWISHPSNCDGWNRHPHGVPTKVRWGLQGTNFFAGMDGRSKYDHHHGGDEGLEDDGWVGGQASAPLGR